MINEVDKETTDIFKWECKIPGKAGVCSAFLTYLRHPGKEENIHSIWNLQMNTPLNLHDANLNQFYSILISTPRVQYV